MKGKMLLSVALFCALFSGALAQEFPIGIWFIGNQRGLDSLSTMHFTWIQSYGGWDASDTNSNYILRNNRNLKLLAIRERNIYFPSFAQRMEYQAERINDSGGIFNYFASHQTGQQDPLDPTLWLVGKSLLDVLFRVSRPLPSPPYSAICTSPYVVSVFDERATEKYTR